MCQHHVRSNVHSHTACFIAMRWLISTLRYASSCTLCYAQHRGLPLHHALQPVLHCCRTIIQNYKAEDSLWLHALYCNCMPN
eukprot:12636-Heterococcus_DN1.PRE.3